MDVYIDVDRTLFDTAQFDMLRWELLEKDFAVTRAGGIGRQEEFFVYDDDSYFYDFSAHMNAIHLDTKRVYEYLAQSELSDGRLEYDGVKELVTWSEAHGSARLLTYGMDDYQKLKVSLCPSLRGLDVITTRESKGQFFRERSNHAVTWMIDDKPIGPELPKDILFMQAGFASVHDTSSKEWPVVWSLREAIDVLQKYQ